MKLWHFIFMLVIGVIIVMATPEPQREAVKYFIIVMIVGYAFIEGFSMRKKSRKSKVNRQ